MLTTNPLTHKRERLARTNEQIDSSEPTQRHFKEMLNPLLSITQTPSWLLSWKREGTQILDTEGRVILFANTTNLSEEETNRAMQLAEAAPLLYSILKQMTQKAGLLDGFHEDWDTARAIVALAEGIPIPLPYGITDWDTNTHYCAQCAYPRSIDDNLEVETCQGCGAASFDLSDRMEAPT